MNETEQSRAETDLDDLLRVTLDAFPPLVKHVLYVHVAVVDVQVLVEPRCQSGKKTVNLKLTRKILDPSKNRVLKF